MIVSTEGESIDQGLGVSVGSLIFAFEVSGREGQYQGPAPSSFVTAIVSILKSEDAVSAVPEIAALLGHAPIHNATFTATELEDGSAAARVRDFGDFLQPRSTAVQLPETGFSAA